MQTPDKFDTFVPELHMAEIRDPTAEVSGQLTDSVLVSPKPRVLIRSRWFERSLALNHRSEWVIGRSKDNHIVLPDRQVSRQHAVLKFIAPATFSLIDLGSLNGSMVNDQRVSNSITLKNGDRISVGETELDFQCPDSNFRMHTGGSELKNILLTSASKVQGEIWREILCSQGLSVIWATREIDLQEALKHLQSLNQPPSLLLIDLEATKNNPYDFCRWCQESHPNLPVILTSGMRAKLFPSERQWATRQGALDLFPGFGTSGLFSNIADIAERVRIILQAVHWQPIEQSPLASTLLALQEQIRNGEP